MPTVSADRLRDLAAAVLEGAGASPKEAATVARYCVAANLAGHDSHGVLQVPVYIDRIDKGHIVPGAPFEIVQESPTTTVVDGHWGFGFVVTERVLDMTINKARKANVAAATVFRQSHIGRLAAYATRATDAGMIALMTADSGRSPKSVAPFGGREARLGTNPIAIAVPSDLDGPFYIDMATSGAALGKIMLASAQGKRIPEGWLVDKNGRQTTDPNDWDNGGVILPLGGSEGHKGYGLSAMVEVLSGLLTGLGFGVEPTGRHNDGCFMACFNVAAFRPLDAFRREVSAFARYLKETPAAEGVAEVLYPGEVEHRNTTHREADGIPVDDKTWGQLVDLAARFGLGARLDLN